MAGWMHGRARSTEFIRTLGPATNVCLSFGDRLGKCSKVEDRRLIDLWQTDSDGLQRSSCDRGERHATTEVDLPQNFVA